MRLALNDQERDFLLELLSGVLRESERELQQYTYSPEHKRHLQRRIVLIEKLKSKLLVSQTV